MKICKNQQFYILIFKSLKYDTPYLITNIDLRIDVLKYLLKIPTSDIFRPQAPQ